MKDLYENSAITFPSWWRILWIK